MRGTVALWPVCAAVVFAPNLRLFPSVSAYDEQRLLALTAFVTAVLLTAASAAGRTTAAALAARVPLVARAAVAGTFALGVASALAGPHVRASLVDVSHTALLAAAAVAVAAAFIAGGIRARTIAATAVTVSIAMASADLGARILALETSGTGAALLNELFSRFHHVRFLGQWTTWTLPLVGMLAFLAPARASLSIATRVLASVWWAVALVSGGRGTIAAQIVAVAVVLIAFGRTALPWVRLHASSAATGVVLYLIGAAVLPGARGALAAAAAHLASFSDSGRSRLWAEALAMVRAAPLLGEGPRAFSYRAALPAAHPHDAPLQWASEWGVPAALLLTALLGGWLWSWLAGARAALARNEVEESDGFARVAIGAALVGAAFHALVCGIVVTPLSQLMAVLVAGWAAGMNHADDGVRAARRPLARSGAHDAGLRGAAEPDAYGSLPNVATNSASRAWALASCAVAFACLVAMAPEIARAWSWRMPADLTDVHLRPRYWSDETSVLRIGGDDRPARRPLRSP